MSRRDGYVVDVPYPLHFYKEMQPTWLAYVVNTLGCVAPNLSAPYTYCELGCGGGINTLVAAACNPVGRFIGVDFNPQHIAAAREAAQQAGITNVEFIEASFEDFAQQDHGPLDFIATHGVWSWLPPQAKRAILQVVHAHLQPQGLLYLQYMCYPGAARLIALQKVLHEVSLATSGSSAQSATQGVALLRQLAQAGAGLFVDNPEIESELVALEKENPDYLAHDFLTDHWQPEHSADVHRMFGQLGMSYLGSANCLENMDSLSVPGNVQPVLAGLPSRSLKETVRDVARNQNQRMDVFQKQPQTLDGQAHMEVLSRVIFVALETMPAPGALEFQTPIGRIPGPSELLTPLMQRLQSGPQSFAQLCNLPGFAQEPGMLLQSLHLLMWNGFVHPQRQDGVVASAAPGLQTWIDAQQLPLRLLPACGSALR